MTTFEDKVAPIQCPSVQATEPNAVVFGVVTGPAEVRRVGYLTEPQPVTAPLLALAGPARPGQIFRMAAPCRGSGCKHFDGTDCRLVQRITAFLDPVVSGVPPCRIRPTCRWFRQEGKAACVRCPQVVTDTARATDRQRSVADPDNGTHGAVPVHLPPSG
jgi:hypothetical protein